MSCDLPGSLFIFERANDNGDGRRLDHERDHYLRAAIGFMADMAEAADGFLMLIDLVKPHLSDRLRASMMSLHMRLAYPQAHFNEATDQMMERFEAAAVVDIHDGAGELVASRTTLGVAFPCRHERRRIRAAIAESGYCDIGEGESWRRVTLAAAGRPA